MILCVCPSPAIDVTYRVPRLAVGGAHRVRPVAHRPGGKAVNTAAVLTALGEPALVLAPVGGEPGTRFATGLSRLGVPADLVDAGAPTRSTVTVVDDEGSATMFAEPADVPGWPALHDRFTALLSTTDVVVISGSLPAGVPVDALADLVTAARTADRPVVLDSSGPALAAALAAGPTVVKPNAEELAQLTGETDPVAGVAALLAAHEVTVVASLGPDGLLAAHRRAAWRARPAHPLRGNPTGAGDALVAALARGLARCVTAPAPAPVVPGGTTDATCAGIPPGSAEATVCGGAGWGEALPGVLVDGVALAGAAVLAPYAGAVDPAVARALRDGVTVQTMEVPR